MYRRAYFIFAKRYEILRDRNNIIKIKVSEKPFCCLTFNLCISQSGLKVFAVCINVVYKHSKIMLESSNTYVLSNIYYTVKNPIFFAQEKDIA